MFSESVVLDHVLDFEVFYGNQGVFRRQAVAELVQEVSPLIADFEVLPSEQVSGFSSISASLLLPAQSLMQEFEFLLAFDEESWVADEFAIAGYCEAFNSHVDADSEFGLMFDLYRLDFAGEYCVPLSSTILFDCQGLNLAFRDAVKFDWDTSYLAKPKLLVAQELESTLWVGYAIDLTLESGIAFVFSVFFDSAEEVLVSFGYPVAHVLFDLRIDFRILASEFLVVVELAHSLASSLVGGIVEFNEVIVDFFASLERIDYPSPLNVRGVYPVTIHPELHEVIENGRH